MIALVNEALSVRVARFSPCELTEKPGVRTLQPGERATLEYRMAFR